MGRSRSRFSKITPATGGAGANGTWTYDSGAAGLTFGTVAIGATKELAFSGNSDGDVYVARLVFSGTGRAGFEIDRVTRNGTTDALDTKFACESGEDFVLATDEPSTPGATFAIRFAARYVDGTEQTMTVELYDGAGTLIDTLTATATTQDAFVSACTAISGCIAVYTPSQLADGNVADNGPCLRDISGNSEPDIELRRVSGTDNWSIGTADAPSTTPSLSKVLSAQNYGSGFLYGSMDGPMSANAASWVLLFKVDSENDGSPRSVMVNFRGDETTGLPPTDSTRGVQGHRMVGTTLQMRNANDSAAMAIASLNFTSWFMAESGIKGTSPYGKLGVSTIGGTHQDVGTTTSTNVQFDPTNFVDENGIVIGHGNQGAVAENQLLKIAAVVAFSGFLADIDFQSIFDSIA